jgi:hypothetical protein
MRQEVKQRTFIQPVDSPSRVKKVVRRNVLSPLICSLLASLGIFGGVSVLFVGIICVVLHAVIPQDRLFDSIGTVLLIAAIPMILTGSIFLDEIDGGK